jgi:hypothetical protein
MKERQNTGKRETKNENIYAMLNDNARQPM